MAQIFSDPITAGVVGALAYTFLPSLNIHNVGEIHLLGFSIQRLRGKSFEISRCVSISPLFSKYD